MTIRTIVLSALLALLIPLAPASAASNVTCEVTASKRVIAPGETVTISWIASHSFVNYGPDGTRIAPLGSMTVTPTEKTIYKFKFVGIGGNEKCGVRIRMQGEAVPV